jgi:hypothetical protein
MTTLLNTWVIEQLDKRHWSQVYLEGAARIPHATLSKDLETNEWTLERAVRVVQALGLDCKSEEDFIKAGLTVAGWLKPRNNRSRHNAIQTGSASRLKDAIEKAEGAAPGDREVLLCEALGTIQLTRRAFLAVISTVVPSPFENRSSPRALRDALFAAHDQGLMALFIAPTETKERLWREQCGFETQEARRHVDGFNAYRDAYIEHLKETGHTNNIVDMHIR